MSLVSLVTFQTVSQKRKLLVGLTLNVDGNGDCGMGMGMGMGMRMVMGMGMPMRMRMTMTMMTPLCTSLLVHCTRPLSFWPPYSRLFLSLHCAKSIHPAQQQQEKQQHLAALWAQTIKGRNKRKKKEKHPRKEKKTSKMLGRRRGS